MPVTKEQLVDYLLDNTAVGDYFIEATNDVARQKEIIGKVIDGAINDLKVTNSISEIDLDNKDHIAKVLDQANNNLNIVADVNQHAVTQKDLFGLTDVEINNLKTAIANNPDFLNDTLEATKNFVDSGYASNAADALISDASTKSKETAAQKELREATEEKIAEDNKTKEKNKNQRSEVADSLSGALKDIMNMIHEFFDMFTGGKSAEMRLQSDAARKALRDPEKQKEIQDSVLKDMNKPEFKGYLEAKVRNADNFDDLMDSVVKDFKRKRINDDIKVNATDKDGNIEPVNLKDMHLNVVKAFGEENFRNYVKEYLRLGDPSITKESFDAGQSKMISEGNMIESRQPEHVHAIHNLEDLMRAANNPEENSYVDYLRSKGDPFPKAFEQLVKVGNEMEELGMDLSRIEINHFIKDSYAAYKEGGKAAADKELLTMEKMLTRYGANDRLSIDVFMDDSHLNVKQEYALREYFTNDGSPAVLEQVFPDAATASSDYEIHLINQSALSGDDTGITVGDMMRSAEKVSSIIQQVQDRDLRGSDSRYNDTAVLNAIKEAAGENKLEQKQMEYIYKNALAFQDYKINGNLSDQELGRVRALIVDGLDNMKSSKGISKKGVDPNQVYIGDDIARYIVNGDVAPAMSVGVIYGESSDEVNRAERRADLINLWRDAAGPLGRGNTTAFEEIRDGRADENVTTVLFGNSHKTIKENKDVYDDVKKEANAYVDKLRVAADNDPVIAEKVERETVHVYRSQMISNEMLEVDSKGNATAVKFTATDPSNPAAVKAATEANAATLAAGKKYAELENYLFSKGGNQALAGTDAQYDELVGELQTLNANALKATEVDGISRKGLTNNKPKAADIFGAPSRGSMPGSTSATGDVGSSGTTTTSSPAASTTNSDSAPITPSSTSSASTTTAINPNDEDVKKLDKLENKLEKVGLLGSDGKASSINVASHPGAIPANVDKLNEELSDIRELMDEIKLYASNKGDQLNKNDATMQQYMKDAKQEIQEAQQALRDTGITLSGVDTNKGLNVLDKFSKRNM